MEKKRNERSSIKTITCCVESSETTWYLYDKVFFCGENKRLFCVFKGYIPICKQSTAAQPKKEPEKIEVFVDGKPVQVEPNTTVLQVRNDRLI